MADKSNKDKDEKLTSDDVFELLKMLEEPGVYTSLFVHIDNGIVVHVEKIDKIRYKKQLRSLLNS